MEELGLGPNGGLIYCMEYPFLYSCPFSINGMFFFIYFAIFLIVGSGKSLCCYYCGYINAVTPLYQFGLLFVFKCLNALNVCGAFSLLAFFSALYFII